MKDLREIRCEDIGCRWKCLELCQMPGLNISDVPLQEPVTRQLVSDSLSLTNIQIQIQVHNFNQTELDAVY